MVNTFRVLAAAGLTIALCAGATVSAQGPAQAGQPVAKGQIYTLPGIRQAFSDADIHFMSGMIPHHAQAVLIAAWAPTHGASDRINLLCERIIVSQRDEIKLMQAWLRDRGQDVPDEKATHHKMKMGDMVHDMLMPGMLTEAELKQLDKARGKDFDRLFLTFMIKHHEGALGMVEVLFKSYGAAQDDDVYKFASDVQADQEMEIERMQQMLAAIK